MLESRRSGRLLADLGRSLALVLAGAGPFLLVQLACNIGVTGHWWQFPFSLYADRDYPQTTLGFHTWDPHRRPISRLAQKQVFHDQWTIPAIKDHQPKLLWRAWSQTRFPIIRDFALPHPLLLLLFPAGLLAIMERRQWVLVASLPLFILTYAFYTFFLPHYTLLATPALIFMALMGGWWLSAGQAPGARMLRVFLPLAIAGVAITSLPEASRFIRDQRPHAFGGLKTINQVLSTLPPRPAVVLFRYDPGLSPQEEPVYNIDVGWPDDARIIRAHDLGERNVEIVRYYAERQPDRLFYRFDRTRGTLSFLGIARDLATTASTSRPPGP